MNERIASLTSSKGYKEMSEELRAEPNGLAIGDFVSWDSSGGRARGRITRVIRDGSLNIPDSEVSITATEEDPAALIRIYRPLDGGWLATETLVGHKFSTLTKIDELEEPEDSEELEEDRDLCQDCDGDCEVCKTETREVNLSAPAYMRAAARQGLKYYEEGKAGDGVTDKTISEARAMAAGNVTPDKWVRIAAWIARHLVDLDSPAANPDSEDYPSAGVVAHLLWGSGPSKSSARRAMDYAQGVVARIEEENEGRARGAALSKMETRTNLTEIEIREEADGMTFTGYAAVFDSPSEPLPFTETIQRGAFKKSLRMRNDIKFLWNHDVGEILGSTRAKTLRLFEDERGLRVEGILPNTSRGRDVAELLRRGDVDSMSFGFSVIKDDWSSDGSSRTLKDVRLFEVSLVSYPAYTATSGTVAVRGLDKVAERSGVDADALADALLKVEDGQSITTEESEMLSRVIGELAPKADPQPKGDMNMLAIKKTKLELLMKGIL